MIDMGHTMMNEEDEVEYEQFYDFARTYINMGLEMKPEAGVEERKKKVKVKGEKGDVSDDSWESVDEKSGDEESGDEAIAEVDEEEEGEEAKKADKSNTASESFEVVDPPSVAG